MPLIECPECGRQISTMAEACPQCGHPNRASREPGRSSGPACYACSGPATTRCVRCNALSCAEHLRSIFVRHGKGGAYELRCRSCHAAAVSWKVLRWVIMGIVLIIMLAFVSQMVGRFW